MLIINKNNFRTIAISTFPYFISICIFFIFKYIFKTKEIDVLIIEKFDLFMEILIPSMITFVGFLVTSITVLIGLSKDYLIKIAMENKILRSQFKRYMLAPIFSGMLIILYGLYLIIETDSSNQIDVFHFSMVVTLIFLFLFNMVRVTIVLFLSFDKNETGDLEESYNDVLSIE